MSDDLSRRMAAGTLADDLAQLQRRSRRLAEAFERFTVEVAEGHPVADHARRLATDALEIALQATRVDAGRQALVLLDAAAVPARTGGDQ